MKQNWYVAELIVEIIVAGDPSVVVHRNFVLLRSCSPDEAFVKATTRGRGYETSYLNPDGRLVTMTFKGIADLDLVHDKLSDGAEILFRYEVSTDPGFLPPRVLPKERLRAFNGPQRADGPDYASAEVVGMVEHRFGTKRPPSQ